RRGAGRRLYADRRVEGTILGHRSQAPCTAQCPAADHHRHCQLDRLSGGRAGDRRDLVSLPRNRQPHLFRRQSQGFSDVGGGRAHRGRDLRRRVAGGGLAQCAAQSAPACRRRRMTTVLAPPRRLRSERTRRAARSATLLVGLAILGFWVLCAVFGSRIAPIDPYADNLLATLEPPSWVHWFGTDQLGRDVFSRVIVGARDILTVAPLATLLGTLLGTALGLFVGYHRGAVDDLVSRIIEALQALPLVIVALMALAAVGTSNLAVVMVIGFVFTPLIARTVRSAVLIESSLDYVAAARLRGDGALDVMFVEILP